jgi:hypothetical protein
MARRYRGGSRAGAGVEWILDACEPLELEPLPDDPRAFAERTYVLPMIEPKSRLRIDFILSSLPYERQAIQRAVRVAIGGAGVAFATQKS